MTTVTTNRKTPPPIITQKLYTQHEVENLLKRSEDDAIIETLVKKSNRILASISSHAFPIDLFPDSLNIEEGRITLVIRHLLSSEVHSIDIKNISNVFINTTLFFSQLVIISKTFEENEIKMRNLWTNEAVYARRMIEGLRIFESKQIDTSIYTNTELIEKVMELSTTKVVI